MAHVIAIQGRVAALLESVFVCPLGQPLKLAGWPFSSGAVHEARYIRGALECLKAWLVFGMPLETVATNTKLFELLFGCLTTGSHTQLVVECLTTAVTGDACDPDEPMAQQLVSYTCSQFRGVLMPLYERAASSHDTEVCLAISLLGSDPNPNPNPDPDPNWRSASRSASSALRWVNSTSTR